MKKRSTSLIAGILCLAAAAAWHSLDVRAGIHETGASWQMGRYLLLIVLPVVAFVVLRQRQLPEQRGDIEPKKQMAIVYLASLVVGAYDGFYGPGTGTFLLLIFCNLAKLDVRTAGGNVKLVNLASNIGALVTSLMSGKVFLVLGLIGTVTSFLGHFLGAGLAIKNGSKIVKPAVILVLVLLAAKVIQGLIAG